MEAVEVFPLFFTKEDWAALRRAARFMGKDYYEAAQFSRSEEDKKAFSELGDQAYRLEKEIKEKVKLSDDED